MSRDSRAATFSRPGRLGLPPFERYLEGLGATKRSSAGENLHLTLDARIQERTEAVLSEVGETYTPQGATAIVMNLLSVAAALVAVAHERSLAGGAARLG